MTANMQTAVRAVVTFVILLAGWQMVVWITGVEFFILPGPIRVLNSLVQNLELISVHAATTFLEIVLGLIYGCSLGMISAISLSWFPQVRHWLLPLLVVAQAIPVSYTHLRAHET